MADFPVSPSPGTTFTAPDGTLWTWDGYSWKSEGGFGGGGGGGGAGAGNANVSILSTAPSAGVANADFWWDNTSGKLKIYYNDGDTVQWVDAFTSTGSLKNWAVKTINYTAIDRDRIMADTSSGSFTITLPASPTVGSFIQITDGNDWSANNLIIDRNGSTIEGNANNVLLDIKGVTVEFIYDGTTWEITSTGRLVNKPGKYDFTFSLSVPNLSVSQGAFRWYMKENMEITNIMASVSTAPVGANVVFDVNKNGTTLFTTQDNRPKILDGEYTSLYNMPDVISLSAGDYLTVDVDEVGTTTAGGYAVVRVSVA